MRTATVVSVLLCSLSGELCGQGRSSPAYEAYELPTLTPDSRQMRDVARSFGRHLCDETEGAIRVVPFRQPADTTFLPRLPDIAPGVLGSFFVALADRCGDRLTSELSAGYIQLMGFRASAGDSSAVLWQVRSPTVEDQWSVSVFRGWVVQPSKRSKVSGVVELRSELYRRVIEDTSTVRPRIPATRSNW
jgi:hypothetical protein